MHMFILPMHVTDHSFLSSPAALSFIPLSTPVFVPRGDETYSGTVYPDVIFPFGTTTVTNIYVRMLMKIIIIIKIDSIITV